MPLLPSNSPPTVLPADVAGVVMGYACTNPHEALQAALVSSSWHQAFLCCTDDMWGRFDVSRSRRVVPHTKPKFHDRTRFIAARSAKKLCAHVEGHVPLSSKTGNEHNHDKNKDEGLSSLALQRVRQQRIASAKIGRCYDDAKAAAAAAKETSSKRRTPTLCDLDDTLTVKPLATDGERERVITKRQVVMKPNELHPIEDCDFAFRCPIFAERLKPTSRMSEFGMPILHCDVCTRDVFVVESQEQVDYCRSNGQCVRFDKKHTDPSYCAQANVLILDAEGGSAAVQVALGILLAAAEQRDQTSRQQTVAILLSKLSAESTPTQQQRAPPSASEIDHGVLPPFFDKGDDAATTPDHRTFRVVSPCLSSPLEIELLNETGQRQRIHITLGTVSSESVIPPDVATIRTLADIPRHTGTSHQRNTSSSAAETTPRFSQLLFASSRQDVMTEYEKEKIAEYWCDHFGLWMSSSRRKKKVLVVPQYKDVVAGTVRSSSATATAAKEEEQQLFTFSQWKDREERNMTVGASKTHRTKSTTNRTANRTRLPPESFGTTVQHNKDQRHGHTKMMRLQRKKTIACGLEAVQRIKEEFGQPTHFGGFVH